MHLRSTVALNETALDPHAVDNERTQAELTRLDLDADTMDQLEAELGTDAVANDDFEPDHFDDEDPFDEANG